MITALQQNSKNNLSLQEMIEKYPKKQRFILPIIHDIQRQYKYIPRQSLESLSEYMNIPFSRLYSMVVMLKKGIV